jgi:hypothetical protein
MDTATEANNNGKRTRFDDIAQCPINASPKERANFCATVALASLPPTIKSLALRLHKEFITLRCEIQRLSSTKERLATPDFIPVSARIKFDLTASSRVKEHADAEFKTLQEHAESAVTFYQSSIKQELRKLITLELNLAVNELRLLYCRAVFALAGAIAINHPGIAMEKTRDLIIYVFEKNYETLLVHSEISTAQEFFDYFKTATEDPAPAHTVPCPDLELGYYAVIPAEESFCNLLEALFVRSWTAYLSTQEEQVRALQLKEFVDRSMKTSATAPVAMDVDNITVDSPALKDFVADEVTKATEALRKQVKGLQVRLQTPKNDSRGASSSARNKKKTDTVKKPKSRQATAQKAAAAANDSTDEPKPRHKKKLGKKKSVSFKNGTKRSKK